MKLDTNISYEILKGVQTVDNYPWGFKLKTQQRYWIEFKKNKGFRAMTQTLDPKKGTWCKPKASTYNDFMFMYKEAETGYIKFGSANINGIESLGKFIELLKANNFEFTPEESENILAGIKLTIAISYAYRRTPEDEAGFLKLVQISEIKVMEDANELKNINIDFAKLKELEIY